MQSKPDLAALRREFDAAPPDGFVDRDTAGAAAHVKRATMEAYAIRGGVLPYVRIGRRALYRKRDVIAWIESGRHVQNTAQLQAG